MNIIEVRGLGKCYGGSWALCECTLAIPAGHVTALVGPNGAGKTTLLNLAVGAAADAIRPSQRRGSHDQGSLCLAPHWPQVDGPLRYSPSATGAT
jgi:ABC-type Mn2+/Zn2+ transport system ATPase subunit